MTVGVLLERAISLYARNAVALLAAFAVTWVPQAILQAFAPHEVVRPIDLRAPGPEIWRSLAQMETAAAPLVLFSLLVAPLGTTAVIVTAVSLLEGSAISVGTALRRALRLWLPAIAVTVIVAAVAAVALFVVAFVVGSVLAAFILLMGLVFHGVIPAFTFVTVLVPAVAVIALMTLAFVTLGMAYVILVLEDANPLRALRAALRRALDRESLSQTALVGLAYLGLEIGGTLVFAAVGWAISTVTRAVAIAAAVSSVGSATVSGVLTVFILLYVRDIRLRREGTDVRVALADPELTDRELIERFLARRDTLAPRARSEIAAEIAARVRPNLRASFDYLDHEALFEHLARSR